MKLHEITAAFESAAPLAYQESYDNAGLAVGTPGMEITAALLCIDVTEEILDEAVRLGVNLVISHHPVLFNPVKKLTGSTYTERIIAKAVRNELALYSVHTNLDNITEGVNSKICEKLGITEPRILSPLKQNLRKLVTFVPVSHAEQVRSALFSAGAGTIGRYDECSFNTEGTGSFRASENTHPFAGEKGILHFEKELRIETIFPAAIQEKLLVELHRAHPYEEVAYDIYPLENSNPWTGAGMVGAWKGPSDERAFLEKVKEIFHCRVIKHSPLLGRPVRTVAVCGGSGSSLLRNAIREGADMFVTSDVKYHQFFDANGRIVIADIGHYESEQYTIEIFYEILTKKLPNFAVHFSSINPNCINYL